MWIVLLNFCLFLLLLSFFFYGIGQWSSLIAEPEEPEETGSVTDEHHYRMPVWILIAGLGICMLLSDILNWIGS